MRTWATLQTAWQNNDHYLHVKQSNDDQQQIWLKSLIFPVLY